MIGLTLAVIAVASCGGDGGGAAQPAAGSFQRVIATDRVFSVDDGVAAGAKKSKQYDATGLSGATDAWLAFFGSDASSRKEFELRFYPSHEAAVKEGTPLAEEGVGEGMKAKKDAQTWTEGAKNRWRAGGVTDVSSPGSRQAPGPKFGDYAIYGNLVMLCEGADSGQSLERCAGLIEAMGGPKAK